MGLQKPSSPIGVGSIALLTASMLVTMLVCEFVYELKFTMLRFKTLGLWLLMLIA